MGLGLLDAVAGMMDSKVKIPDAPIVNMQDAQRRSILNNEVNLPAAEKLTSETNTFAQDQILAMLRKAIPGYDNISTQISDTIQKQLSGTLSDQVMQEQYQKAAASNLRQGIAGSGAGLNKTVWTTGQESLRQIQQGMDSATKWIAEADALFSPGRMNVQSMFVTPQQIAENDWKNATSVFQRNYVSNINDYQHSTSHLLSQALYADSATIQAMLMSYMGASGGSKQGGQSGIGMGSGGGMSYGANMGGDGTPGGDPNATDS